MSNDGSGRSIALGANLFEQQVIHRLNSPNVLKFYDWYETRNNVWLILEFCTGGDLLTLIKQVKNQGPGGREKRCFFSGGFGL